MSFGPLYRIREHHMYSQQERAQVEAYGIDRMPAGALAAHVVAFSSRVGCNPCGSAQVDTPSGYAIKLPVDVKAKYPDSHEYVDTGSLPGFLTWLIENGYDVVDLDYVTPVGQGIWIELVDGDAEFRAGARARAGRPAAKAKSAPRPKPAPKPRPAGRKVGLTNGRRR